MENETSPGGGWWQASDGNWYRPESHPDYVPLPAPDAPSTTVADTPPTAPLPAEPLQNAFVPQASLPAPNYEPTAAPAVPPGPQFASAGRASAPAGATAPETAPSYDSSRPWWKHGWLAAVLAALVLAAAIPFVSSNDSSSSQAATGESTAAPGDRPANDPEPTARAAEPADQATTLPAAETNGDAAPGDRSNPFGFGSPAPVTLETFGDADGSVWNVTVQAPRDMTAQVLATNEFNEPPPEGVTFVGFDVEVTLASAKKEPLSSGFSLEWAIAGGDSNALYEAGTIEDLFGCGQIRNEYNLFAEVFVSGTIAGTVCIPLPIGDLNHPQTQPVVVLNDSLVAFGAGGVVPTPATIDTPRQSASEDEIAFDTIAAVLGASYDDDVSVWNVQLGSPRDITDQVVAASDFNDAPPDGILYVGFDAEVTLASADVEPVAIGLNHNWEILGGATAGVYNQVTFAGLFGCGSFGDELDDFDELFVGGTARGVVCLPVPAEDLDHPSTKIAMNFQGNRVVFSADGQTQPAAEIQAGSGPAGLANMSALSEAVELRWDVFGDADGSLWATTVEPRRDITAQVLAENEFNDPPPEGVVYVGFDVELTLIDAQTEPLSPSFNISWEILGGETLRVYKPSTLVPNFGCGVTPGELDVFAEVFPGGTVRGTVCMPLLIEDLDHPDTRIALVIGEDRIPFGP